MAHIIYWEPQQLLHCAIHACNNLLQMPLFTERSFQDIAQKLDAEERRLFGMPTGAASENVGRGGNWSVQVIIGALAKAGLNTDFFGGDKSHTLPLLEGIICNRAEHWLALRCLGSGRDWYIATATAAANRRRRRCRRRHRMACHHNRYNLDSLSPQGPNRISRHVHQYLSRLKAGGYTVLLVLGKFPKASATASELRMLLCLAAPIMMTPRHHHSVLGGCAWQGAALQPASAQVDGRGAWFDSRKVVPRQSTTALCAQARRVATVIGAGKTSSINKGWALLRHGAEADAASRYAEALEHYSNGIAFLVACAPTAPAAQPAKADP